MTTDDARSDSRRRAPFSDDREGLVTKRSPWSVAATVSRLVATVAAKRMKVADLLCACDPPMLRGTVPACGS